MAGLRSAVLFAAFLLLPAVFLLLPAASSQSSPAVYRVGDEMGWAAPPAGATDALTDWAARHLFFIGDVLDFKIGSNNSVLLVLQGDYERCSAANPLSGFGFVDGGRDIMFTLRSPGIYYFIGGEPARCEAGQRMAVRVVDARRPSLAAGTPAPAPPGSQLSETPPPPVHRRLSLAQKQFAAAAIGFGAGFLLIFFILWLFVCCRSRS